MLLTYVLYEYGFPTAAGFGLTRSFLSMLFLGRLSSAIFSLTGMVFAVLAMGAAKKCGLFSPLGVNVSGSVLHVFGQLLASAFVTETVSVLGLLPVYVCVSVVCGVLTYIPLMQLAKRCRSEIRREAKKRDRGNFPRLLNFVHCNRSFYMVSYIRKTLIFEIYGDDILCLKKHSKNFLTVY